MGEKEECQSVPRTQCSEVSNRQCHSFPKQECTDVPKLQCVQVPKVECQDLNRRSCSEVPVQDCQQKPRRVCSLVPSILTKEVSDRQCTTSQRNVCQPIFKQVCNDVNEPRQECNDVVEQVPRQIYETECKTEYTQECSQPRSGGYGTDVIFKFISRLYVDLKLKIHLSSS